MRERTLYVSRGLRGKLSPTSYDVYKRVSVPSLALALPRHTTSLAWARS